MVQLRAGQGLAGNEAGIASFRPQPQIGSAKDAPHARLLAPAKDSGVRGMAMMSMKSDAIPALAGISPARIPSCGSRPRPPGHEENQAK